MKSRTDLSTQEIESIINDTEACHVAMVDAEGMPYVLPFNFGFREGRLYIHSGPEGKKIDVWRRNPNVCVAFSSDYKMRIQNEAVACSYSMRYRSVLIHGKVSQIDNLEEKKRVLDIIMAKYSGKDDFTYSLPALTNVNVFEIAIGKIEGRAYGY